MSTIEDALKLTQTVFSVPTFLVCTSYFGNCISVLAILVFIKIDTEIKFFMRFQWASLLIFSSTGMLAILWKAGSLPIEAEKLKKAYRRKCHQKLIFGNKVGEHFETDLIDTSNFVLSACNIIYFYRSTLLAFAGTILTYTVLLMSKS
ncbi:uncharacterized protein TNCT_481561 [Trichonephila clavata]|uniref:Uncharacterized protein n=1 Tax=Trichonephila clavata TaxID=2740835 RepID=A0A8X6KLQ9_TRICU|nr:uncharacterized protein TNCT_481561 [Trichonephila clavata]